jgi:hypothetical protein
MARRTPLGLAVPHPDDPRMPWYAPAPSVRILCYSDDTDVALDPDNPYGIGLMRDLAARRRPFFAQIEFEVLHRHAPSHGAAPLTAEVLAGYDELWVFGLRLQRSAAQPDNEISDAEREALSAWMAAGGVLVTGDHANPADSGAPALLGMGRALGHRIPRAGSMRRWEGPPDISEEASFNTQVPDGVRDPHDLTLQEDERPQRLILARSARRQVPNPFATRWRPHPLFAGASGPIDRFPDHQHEGMLTTDFGGGDWPERDGVRPLPEVAASGVDSRSGRVYPIVSTYDGDDVGVGRVVADTSWHHYFNINLWGFPDEVTDSIGDYYTNLAVWLAPRDKRRAMRDCLYWWLATHPTVRMVWQHPSVVIGRTAVSALHNEIGARDVEALLTLGLMPATGPVLPIELLVGRIVHELNVVFRNGGPALGEVAAIGARHAVREAREEVSGWAETLDRMLRDLDGRFPATADLATSGTSAGHPVR